MGKITDKITRFALEIIELNPGGIRFSDLKREIHKIDNELNLNTIHGVIWNLDHKFDKIEKISRGVFALKQDGEIEDQSDSPEAGYCKEEEFYEPFANWIVSDIEDASKAVPLGGKKFSDKWATPDVIGIRRSKHSDIIQMPIEIVSAEIKTNSHELMTAFGQSCAYCLFSHKSYLVIPNTAKPADISRLDSLCQVLGIGLVLFNATNSENPDFEFRVRPHKQDPDMFYANKYIKEVERELFH